MNLSNNRDFKPFSDKSLVKVKGKGRKRKSESKGLAETHKQKRFVCCVTLSISCGWDVSISFWDRKITREKKETKKTKDVVNNRDKKGKRKRKKQKKEMIVVID